jgi:hypothetical protein
VDERRTVNTSNLSLRVQKLYAATCLYMQAITLTKFDLSRPKCISVATATACPVQSDCLLDPHDLVIHISNKDLLKELLALVHSIDSALF